MRWNKAAEGVGVKSKKKEEKKEKITGWFEFADADERVKYTPSNRSIRRFVFLSNEFKTSLQLTSLS